MLLETYYFKSHHTQNAIPKHHQHARNLNAPRPLHLPTNLTALMGHPSPQRPKPYNIRLARRPHKLPNRDRLPRIPTSVATASPRHRQRHYQIPFHILALVPACCGSASPEMYTFPRPFPEKLNKNVEIAWECDQAPPVAYNLLV
jgi:hypothetical protein